MAVEAFGAGAMGPHAVQSWFGRPSGALCIGP